MKKLILFYGAIMAGVILALIWKWNAPELFSRLIISRSDLLLLQNVTINFWNSFLPIVIKRGKKNFSTIIKRFFNYNKGL